MARRPGERSAAAGTGTPPRTRPSTATSWATPGSSGRRRTSTRPTSACSDRVRGRRVLEVGCGAAQCSRWLARRARRRSASTCRSRSCGMRPRCDERTGMRRPRRAGRRGHAALRGVVVRPGVLRVRRGAVRRRHRGGDARGGAGAAAGRPLGVLGDPPDALVLPGRPGPEGAGREARRTSTGRRTSRSDDDGTPTYVEHHRTLGDRVRELVDAGFRLVDLVEPEWPDGHDRPWGQWSPLRGRVIPGTAIFVSTKD